MNSHGRAALFVAALAELTACQVDDLVCTANVAIHSVQAVDSHGLAVSGLTITDSVVKSHEVFEVEQFPGQPAGLYIVFGDHWRQRLVNGHGTVKVAGRKGAIGFDATYFFDVSDCHSRKVSGPDTVVVQ